jgi:hypothetical protein
MASSERSEDVFQQFQTLFNKQTAIIVEIEKQVEEERKRRIFYEEKCVLYEEKCERLEKELNHLNSVYKSLFKLATLYIGIRFTYWAFKK